MRRQAAAEAATEPNLQAMEDAEMAAVLARLGFRIALMPSNGDW